MNAEQVARWNGGGGQAWVAMQALMDRMYLPFNEVLIEAVAGARSVLDVGCGTGSTTVAIARAGAECIGVDVAEPMVEAAKRRAEQAGVRARFVRADAQDHAFQEAAFDAVVSRFGVMFFSAPVRAFANLRRAARPNASLRFIAWRGIAENPFQTTAERAAAPLLPGLPPRDPDAPGQFAFADPERVRKILQASGWGEVGVRPIDVPCVFPEEELTGYLSRMGPVGLALREADESTQAKVIAAVRPAFDEFVHDEQVRFNAACWVFGARYA